MSKIPPLYAAILAGVFLVCATVAGILIPTERWEKLGHFLTDPATALALTALGGAFVALYTRARNLPPAAVLLVALLGASVSGCGAQLSDSQRASLATETQRCLIAEREIVDEPCGDLAPAECRDRDMEALRAERARCDAARAEIVGGAP